MYVVVHVAVSPAIATYGSSSCCYRVDVFAQFTPTIHILTCKAPCCVLRTYVRGCVKPKASSKIILLEAIALRYIRVRVRVRRYILHAETEIKVCAAWKHFLLSLAYVSTSCSYSSIPYVPILYS